MHHAKKYYLHALCWRTALSLSILLGGERRPCRHQATMVVSPGLALAQRAAWRRIRTHLVEELKRRLGVAEMRAVLSGFDRAPFLESGPQPLLPTEAVLGGDDESSVLALLQRHGALDVHAGLVHAIEAERELARTVPVEAGTVHIGAAGEGLHSVAWTPRSDRCANADGLGLGRTAFTVSSARLAWLRAVHRDAHGAGFEPSLFAMLVRYDAVDRAATACSQSVAPAVTPCTHRLQPCTPQAATPCTQAATPCTQAAALRAQVRRGRGRGGRGYAGGGAGGRVRGLRAQLATRRHLGRRHRGRRGGRGGRGGRGVADGARGLRVAAQPPHAHPARRPARRPALTARRRRRARSAAGLLRLGLPRHGRALRRRRPLRQPLRHAARAAAQAH